LSKCFVLPERKLSRTSRLSGLWNSEYRPWDNRQHREPVFICIPGISAGISRLLQQEGTTFSCCARGYPNDAIDLIEVIMKVVMTLLGLVVVGAGLLGLFSPDELLTIGRDVLTPTGLSVIAFIRVCVGLLLISLATASRMPKTVRILGGISLIAGVATPFFGVDRSVSVLNWWAAQGPVVERLAGLVLVGMGAFMIYAFRSISRQSV
jgi:hypothetical protein